MQWLSIQQVQTVEDFDIKTWQQKISREKQYLKIEEQEETKFYCLDKQRRGYNLIELVPSAVENEMMGIVG